MKRISKHLHLLAFFTLGLSTLLHAEEGSESLIAELLPIFQKHKGLSLGKHEKVSTETYLQKRYRNCLIADMMMVVMNILLSLFLTFAMTHDVDDFDFGEKIKGGQSGFFLMFFSSYMILSNFCSLITSSLLKEHLYTQHKQKDPHLSRLRTSEWIVKGILIVLSPFSQIFFTPSKDPSFSTYLTIPFNLFVVLSYPLNALLHYLMCTIRTKRVGGNLHVASPPTPSKLTAGKIYAEEKYNAHFIPDMVMVTFGIIMGVFFYVFGKFINKEDFFTSCVIGLGTTSFFSFFLSLISLGLSQITEFLSRITHEKK